MKIVRIDGGLGNQMFCYAFALALAHESGEDVLIDTHRYKFFPNHFGYELDRLFNVTLKEATFKQLWKVTYPTNCEFVSRIFQRFPKRKHEIIEDFEKCNPNIFIENLNGYYIGNWQWYKYFDNIRDLVIKTFTFKQPLDDRNERFNKILLDEYGSVGIHIRRGDYLSNPQYLGICELDYYTNAIKKAMELLGNCHFVIFSNDMDWCNSNIVPLVGKSKYTMVDWNTGTDSHRDMRLMSSCRMNIIANSSFSWWGAYLNSREDRIVVSPDRWINRPLDYRIQCDDWICL